MSGLAEAERYCEARGLRLTAPRRKVLSVVIGAPDSAISAYDILALMPAGTQPPTVYRALDFWMAHGFIHRISSLNLYAACHAGHRHQGSQYMICESCGSIAEIHLCHLPAELEQKTAKNNFTPTSWSAELHGLCSNCG